MKNIMSNTPKFPQWTKWLPIAIPVFIHDFLCIHPFNDGNGRMSRLLTTLLLYRSGFYVGKYISLEAKIAKSKDLYYDALLRAQHGWLPPHGLLSGHLLAPLHVWPLCTKAVTEWPCKIALNRWRGRATCRERHLAKKPAGHNKRLDGA